MSINWENSSLKSVFADTISAANASFTSVSFVSGIDFSGTLSFGSTVTAIPSLPATATNVFLECTVNGTPGYAIPLYILP